MSRPSQTVIAIGSAAVVIVADQASKAWAQSRLALGPCDPEANNCIELIGSLRLHLVENPGMAFSLGQNWPLGPVLTIVGVIMAVVLVRMSANVADWRFAVVAGGIAGGALGNVIDRITRSTNGWFDGHVVDFIDLQWWPVFNVADMAIVGGIATLVLFGSTLYRKPEVGAVAEPAATDPA